jgi:hypothetical protein
MIDFIELISKKMKSVPLGTSEYQASWIVDEDANNQEDEEVFYLFNPASRLNSHLILPKPKFCV